MVQADPMVMATVASVVAGFGVAMLFFRIKREREMHDEDEAIRIPWADRLLIAATVTSLLCGAKGQVLRSRIARPPGSLSVHAHRRPCPSAPA